MIKFFRQIRFKLMETGKTGLPASGSKSIGRYLKYAIGEIVLVVIGILIALSINNWNQLRLNKKETTSLKKSLLIDLSKDSTMLHTAILFYTNLLTKNNLLVDKCNADLATIDTIKNAAKEFDPSFHVFNSFNTTTLNSIESSGKLDLLDDPLKTKLLEYKQKLEENLIQVNEGIYLDRINQYQAKYKFGPNKSKYLYRLNEYIENEREYVNLFTSLIGYKNFMMKSSLNRWKQTLDKNRVLIEFVNAQLKK